MMARTRSHLYRPGTSKASSRNPPSGPTTPTTSQTPPNVNRKRKKTDSSGPREYDNNDIDVQAVDEPVEQKAEPVELSESSASRKSRKVKRSEMLVPRNAATDSDSDASGFLTREPIPSTSTACKYPQMYTKDVGVQVEECQTLYPVGMLNESHPIKPEASQLFDDMKQRLECPVCCKISLPPVMQCRNGHVTCNNCRLKVRSCPMCREVDIDIRNLFAEKAVSYMTITCEYSHYGCKVEMPFRDRDLHQRDCKHRPFNCPYIECEHKFVARDVVPHVSTAHRDDCRNSEGPEITASMILIGNFFGGDGAWSPRVITCFDRTFFDVALTRDRWLHHWVWLLGEEEDAANFVYEITAFKGNTKYLYAGEVASLRTPDEEIVSTGQCLSISDPIGKRLRDGDKIRYKLKLSRKELCAANVTTSR